MKPRLNPKLYLLFLLPFFCALTACRDLDPGGVYKSDQVLYQADQSITDAYDLLHTFLLWEYQNRPSLPKEVTQAADAVRDHCQDALKTAVAARRAYAANPSSGDTASSLQSALEVLKTVLTQVQQYVPKKGS